MKQISFNKKLYIDSLRRLRMLGLVLLALCIIFTLFPLFTSDYLSNVSGYADLTPMLGAYMFFAPLLLVFSAFSFLFKRNSSDLYHALPITRTGLYITLFAAVATWLIGSILITRLLAYISFLSKGQSFTPAYIILQTISYCAGTLLVAACALIGVSLTGTRFSAFVVSGVILFLPRCISVLCMSILNTSASMLAPAGHGFLFDFTLNIPIMTFLEEFLGLGYLLFGRSPFQEAHIISYQSQIYTFALTAVYGALGAVAFHRRASETAEKSAPSSIMQHVYRSLISIPLFLMLASFFALDGSVVLDDAFILLFIFALLVYFLYELITTKRFKNLLSALYTLPIPLLLCFGISFGTVAYGNVQIRILPSADELDFIQFAPASHTGSTYSNLLISEIAFSEPELLKLASDSLQSTYEEQTRGRYPRYDSALRFARKHGSDIVRKISVPSHRLTRFYALLDTNATYRAAVMALPQEHEIYALNISPSHRNGVKGEDMAALANLFALLRQDYARLSYEDMRLLNPSATEVAIAEAVTKEGDRATLTYRDDAALDLRLLAEGMRKGRLFSDSYRLTQKTPNATNAAMQYCNAREHKTLNAIRAVLNGNANITWANIQLRLFNVPLHGTLAHTNTLYMNASQTDVEDQKLYEDSLGASISDCRALLALLLSGDLNHADIDRTLVQFEVRIELEDENKLYITQATNYVYAALDTETARAVLAMFPEDAPVE